MARLYFVIAAGLVLAAPAAHALCPVGEARSGVCRELQTEEDTVAVQLLQVGKQRVETAADSARLEAPATHVVKEGAKQIPGLGGLGDIINSATDAVNSVVGGVTDAVGNLTGSITDVVGQAADIPTQAALTTASTLNQTLLALGEQATKVRAQCWQYKDDVLAKLNVTSNDTSVKLAAFQVQIDTAVNELVPLWKELSVSVSTAASAASTVLKTVGQQDIATSLEANVRLTLDKGDAFTQSLGNVSKQLGGLDAMVEAEVASTLDAVRAKFDEAYVQVEALSDQLTETFEGLTTQAAAQMEKIPGANASAVSEAFASVAATADEVVAEIVAGPKDFVGNLSAVTAATREEVAPSGAGQARLAAGLLAVVAALALHAA